MSDYLSTLEENIKLKYKLIKKKKKNIEINEKLVTEIQDSIKILNEKSIILNELIKRNKETIEIMDILKIALDAMEKTKKNMGVLDPNREILTNAFTDIMKRQTISNE